MCAILVGMQDLQLSLVEVTGGHNHAVANLDRGKDKPKVGCHRGLAAGRCHICRDLAPVEHILAIGHWVCLDCQNRLMGRGVEFMRAMVQGESLDCCGPIARLG